MDKRINRFTLCDIRFHPYLVRVIERLPDEVREDFLNDTSFQLLTDDEISEVSVLRCNFSEPVRSLVFLHSKILMKPNHQIIHTIASEIAYHVLNKSGTEKQNRNIDNLLTKWGFGREVEAVRNDRAASKKKK